jgi:hypothetical protein
MDYGTDLTNEEIDLLLKECEEQLDSLRGELGMIMIKKDMLNKKYRQWKDEKEWLQLLRDEDDFTTAIVKVPHDTLKSIRGHYGKLMRRASKLGIDKD